MPDIHPTALVDPAARIADDVRVGPYCTIGPACVLGAGTRLISHVVIDGNTEVGKACTFFPFCSIGHQTQDLKFKGGRPGVRIGSHNTFREYVTVNAATYDGDYTTVGSHCHIMAYVHVAHDCSVGDRVIIANAGTLAGHVIIEDGAIIGGLCGIHQFVRIGRLSITGGCSKVVKDIAPFMMADGNPLSTATINKVGLQRNGLSEAEVASIRTAHKIIFRRNLTVAEATAAIRSELPSNAHLEHLIRFVESSERGITR